MYLISELADMYFCWNIIGGQLIRGSNGESAANRETAGI